jgi:hypothetical protein
MIRDGLKIIGIKAAIASIHGGGFDHYTQVDYDMLTGEVLTEEFIGCGNVIYDSQDIISVGCYRKKPSVEDLADDIVDAVRDKEREDMYWKQIG